MIGAILYGLLGGLIGSIIFYYMLSYVITASDREATIQQLPFNCAKIMLVLILMLSLGFLQYLIIAILVSFMYRCFFDLKDRQTLDTLLNELDDLWKQINSKDDK